jgi:hypothetical protein
METAIMDSKRRFRMAVELLWFASASFGAGLLAAIVGAALVILLAQPAYAHTFRDVDFVCPIDGEEFSQRMAASGTSYGRMLDLKPYGPTAAPWTLPVCPTTGFVMYRSRFTDDEIAKLRPYVDSYEYWALRRSEATYYLVAKLQGVLGEPDEAIAPALLHATWQAQGREQYERYAREALMVYRRLLEMPPRDERKRITYELVSGELERRLGMFEQARGRFERVRALEASATGVVPDIIELQLKLLSAKDPRPHQAPPRKSMQPVRRVEL